MSLLPARFFFRVSYLCAYVPGIPTEEGDTLLDLPETCRIENFAALEGSRNFADVRMAWNEGGLGLQVEVRGKSRDPVGRPASPDASDGVTLWVDTRDARASHRASKTCHQFHFLPAGGGDEGDEPLVLQQKIHRAQEDAPLAAASSLPFRSLRIRSGYRLEAFLPSSVLYGFDPEQNPRLGFTYAVRDTELGLQVLSVGADFPYAEDPSLWSVLELSRPE